MSEWAAHLLLPIIPSAAAATLVAQILVQVPDLRSTIIIPNRPFVRIAAGGGSRHCPDPICPSFVYYRPPDCARRSRRPMLATQGLIDTRRGRPLHTLGSAVCRDLLAFVR